MGKRTIDWDKFTEDLAKVLAALANPVLPAGVAEVLSRNACAGGTEADLVSAFVQQEQCGFHEDDIPMTPCCTIVREMSFKYGRADLVVFHSDGSATVIEAKDGSKGYNHVVAGIGQAGLYAAQLAMGRHNLTTVRRALLWSSTGDSIADLYIMYACEAAGIVPLMWPAMKILVACSVYGKQKVEDARAA